MYSLSSPIDWVLNGLEWWSYSSQPGSSFLEFLFYQSSLLCWDEYDLRRVFFYWPRSRRCVYQISCSIPLLANLLLFTFIFCPQPTAYSPSSLLSSIARHDHYWVQTSLILDTLSPYFPVTTTFYFQGSSRYERMISRRLAPS